MNKNLLVTLSPMGSDGVGLIQPTSCKSLKDSFLPIFILTLNLSHAKGESQKFKIEKIEELSYSDLKSYKNPVNLGLHEE